jgi:hypothetical protein
MCATLRRGLRTLFASGLLLLSRRDTSTTDTQLARLFAHPASARAIGAAYVRAHSDHARDTESLAASLPPCPIVAGLRAAIAAEVSDGFANERVVIVEGRMLSPTEARPCGLIHLVV